MKIQAILGMAKPRCYYLKLIKMLEAKDVLTILFDILSNGNITVGISLANYHKASTRNRVGVVKLYAYLENTQNGGQTSHTQTQTQTPRVCIELLNITHCAYSKQKYSQANCI